MAIPLIQQTGRNIRQVIENSLFGAFCGAIGGIVTGSLFGAIFAIGHLIATGDPLFFFPFVFPAGFTGGLIGGFIIGTFIGATIIVTRPYLRPLSQLFGVITIIPPGLVMASLAGSIWGVAALLIGAIIAGFIGGTVAYRAYHAIFPDTAVTPIS